MSRAISTAVAAQIAAPYAIPRTLFRRHLDSGLILRTDHHADITFQGEVYEAEPCKHSVIKSYLANKVDSTTITLGNVDQAESAILTYEDCDGRKCEIWKVFINPATGAVINGATDKIVQFTGYMDEPEDDEQDTTIRVKNMFDRGKMEYPYRRFGTRCNNRFCDTRCTYNGSSRPQGTASAGSTTGLTSTALAGISTMVNGQVKFSSGNNSGVYRTILTHNTTSGEITFDELDVTIAANDEFYLDCGKLRSDCEAFSNTAHFDGFDNSIEQWSYHITSTNISKNKDKDNNPFDIPFYVSNNLTSGDIANESKYIPLVYGRRRVTGTLIKAAVQSSETASGYLQTRVYAFAVGECSGIAHLIVNGVDIALNSTYVQTRLGLASQSIRLSDFGAGVGATWEFGADEVLYWPNTVIICIRDRIPGSGSDSNPAYLGRSENVFTSSPESDTVEAVLDGKLVQAYDASGTPVGIPAFSTNPIWCYVDFMLTEIDRPFTTSEIDWASAYASAVVCSLKKFTLNFVIGEANDEPSIIDQMMFSCRGYVYYPGGKIAPMVEQKWTAAPAFVFGDGYNGSAKNIVGAKIKTRRKTTDDTPNRVIVTYQDATIRDISCQLVSGITADQTTIEVDNVYGEPAASGTLYIDDESFTYTGWDGTYFTGCSARASAYPADMPIYQGTQLFSERTAQWDDWADQDDKRRVIKKEINAPGISTYEHAYKIAEWYGEKSLKGNLLAEFTGGMNSLSLTVGDVVSITGGHRNWIAWLFRIIETQETQDEEVTYVCELYHDAFYAENVAFPSVPYITKLDNPMAIPPQVTALAVAEELYIGTDGTILSRLVVTYTRPTFVPWDRAEIFIKIGAGSYWLVGTDYSGGVEFVIETVTGGFVVGDTVYVKAISVSQNNRRASMSTALEESVVVMGKTAAPSNVTGFTATVAERFVYLTWNHIADVDRWSYSIRKGASWAAGTPVVSEITGNEYQWLPDEGGTVNFWIKAYDTSGIESTTADTAQVVIVLPSISGLSAPVLDNNVTLKWTGVQGTFPVENYEVRRGAVYATSELVGIQKVTFMAFPEMTSGTYEYWVTAIDSMGLYGTPVSVSATVTEPTDFVLHQEQNDFFTGAKTNIVFDAADNCFYGPVSDSQGWDTYSGGLSGTTMQDYIDAATYAVEPAEATGSYVKTFDYSTIISAAIVTAVLTSEVLIGTVTVTPKIETSPDNSTWTVFDGVWQAYSTSFRYVRITLSLTAASAANVRKFTNLYIKLTAKEADDSGNGSVTVADDGWVFKFSKLFFDIISVTPSAKGTTARTALYSVEEVISTTVSGSIVDTVKLTAGQGAAFLTGDWIKVELPTGPEQVQITGIATDDLSVAPALSAAPAAGTICFPASVRVYLFDTTGAKVTGDCGCKVTGLV